LFGCCWDSNNDFLNIIFLYIFHNSMSISNNTASLNIMMHLTRVIINNTNYFLIYIFTESDFFNDSRPGVTGANYHHMTDFIHPTYLITQKPKETIAKPNAELQ